MSPLPTTAFPCLALTGRATSRAQHSEEPHVGSGHDSPGRNRKARRARLRARICDDTSTDFAGPLREQRRISARSAVLLLVSLLLAFLIVDVSKYREMLATGRLGEVFARQNRAVAEPYRKSGVCFVPDDRGDWGRGYSVFQLETAPASGWGKAMVLEWGWDNYDKVVVDGLPSRCSPELPRLRVGRDGLARSEEVPPAADRTRP
jgi:hypothetical protein